MAHAFPGAPQTGSVLHVHAAEPAAPVQLWWTGHETGVPYARNPLLRSMQVARPPGTQDVCPWLQLSLHVVKQAALGALPEQHVAQPEVEAT
ncbi:MAG: hypothetical protein ABJA82_07430 [Myxococcales bacterium]